MAKTHARKAKTVRGICEICGKGARLSVATTQWTYEQVRSAIVDAVKAGEHADLELARYWHRLVHDKLWVGHYASPTAFLKGELGGRGLRVPKRSTLNKMARVALTFVEPDLGWEILLLALEYWDRTGHKTFSRDNPGDEIIRVPQGGGSVLEKTLRTCTEQDMRDALRALKTRANPGLSPKDLALEKLLQAGLDKLVGASGHGSIHLIRKNGQRRFRLAIEADEGRLGGLLDLLKL